MIPGLFNDVVSDVKVVDDELERMWMEAVTVHFQTVLSQLHTRTNENNKKSQSGQLLLGMRDTGCSDFFHSFCQLLQTTLN